MLLLQQAKLPMWINVVSSLSLFISPIAKVKCWQLTCLKSLTRSKLDLVPSSSRHVSDLTVTSRGGGEVGAVRREGFHVFQHL